MKNEKIRLDLNSPVFQRTLFNLEKREQTLVLNAFRKMLKMNWEEIYNHPGLKWEAIYSHTGPEGERLYSFRIGKKFRAIAFRQGEWLRILSLHPIHDSAYENDS